MVKIIKRIALDLNKSKVYGWEGWKSALVIASMIEGIKLNLDFPAVDVVRNNKGIYELLFGGSLRDYENYGGHHRTISHYIESATLQCNLWNGHVVMPDNKKRFGSIEDIVLTDYKNMQKLKRSLSYLPLDVSERFCEDNGLDSEYYLAQ